jgi:C-terminal processing protease CtpA/Prc
LALGAVVYGLRALFIPSPRAPKYASVVYAFQSAITNPVDFAKSHVTGGIGAMLLADPASGLPQIRGIVAGSPAQRAGLRGGDVILAIDGMTTHGRTLAQDVQNIRGLPTSSVMLTIQRADSTNLNCVIHRTSWSGMGIRP